MNDTIKLTVHDIVLLLIDYAEMGVSANDAKHHTLRLINTMVKPGDETNELAKDMMDRCPELIPFLMSVK